MQVFLINEHLKTLKEAFYLILTYISHIYSLNTILDIFNQHDQLQDLLNTFRRLQREKSTHSNVPQIQRL